MAETEDVSELLFFDTFSHEVDTDINLDLVQFPKPVYITQIRIIPLGARVQADFPGGVRLGATNPSTFDIEFFVNDLGIQNAPTFENLGHLKYNQNDCIHLECGNKIATDGLVLRGLYSTITLAVYGITRTTLNEPIASPPPLDPVEAEELCELNADNRNAGHVDDEWKEIISSDIGHKALVSDYERESLEYEDAVSRDHFHHHHSGDERERRMRKSSPRHRTRSGSNERDYVRTRSERDREKSGREWSRSPDYSRRSRRKRSDRSRSDAEESHKWPPRTPPASIDSPARPRSPDNIMDYTEDDGLDAHDMRYKLKARAYTRSRESLGDAAIIQDTQTIDDDETPGTPVEQYEPILSDDEIIGDDDSNAAAEQTAADEFEAELQAAAAAAIPAIDKFDPYKMSLCRHVGDLHVQYSKELENLNLLVKKFELQTKCGSLSVFLSSATSVDERENFVFLSEQLINHLNYLGLQFKRRNMVLKQFFKTDTKNLLQIFSIVQIALDFQAANAQMQPAFKTRHIKIGARLTELLGGCSEFLSYLLHVQKFNPFSALLKLYKREYMALSIKLMMLRAIYALLDTKVGLQYFLSSDLKGYQLILDMLKQTNLTRTKYALQAIIKKLNLQESLDCIRENCTHLFVLSNYNASKQDAYEAIEKAIEQVMEAVAYNSLAYQQPRRFLPVSKKFEIVMDAAAQRSFSQGLQSFFVQQSLAESLLLLLSNASELPVSLLLKSLELLRALLGSQIGIDYLVDDCFEATEMLLALLLGTDNISSNDQLELNEDEVRKCENNIKLEIKQENPTPETETEIAEKSPLIQPKEEDSVNNENKEKISKSPNQEPHGDVEPKTVSKFVENCMQELGFELAFKVQTRYHLDVIDYIATTSDYDALQVVTHLHALYSQTCDMIGRPYTTEFLGFNSNLQVLMDLIKKEKRLQAQQQQHSNKYKSPVLMYTVDVIDCCVRNCENLNYLIEHGVSILELAKNHDSFEPSVSAVLQEMYVYLKPLEAIQIFAYDDITPLVEVITRSLEYITTCPGDLIMGLRILRHLAIGGLKGGFKSSQTEELKHRFVALQFYAADGVQTLLHILEKLCNFFEQPGLHKPVLRGLQGLHCCQIILPTLQVLRCMISFAIQTRDVDFKDLTAIDYLLKTYFLLYHVPENCNASKLAEMGKEEIISLLLAYTQPHEQNEELLHKSLWTQMIREVLKNIEAPHTLLPGLNVLAELLPLPLPIPLPNDKQLQRNQTQRLITERKLWSAHLHPQSLQIARLIEAIAPTTFPQLSDLLVRVCLQLADLAPNMTLLISKTISDLLCNEWSANGNTPTAHLERLLHFFSRLTIYATLKSSALSILCGKLWDVMQSILYVKEPSPIGYKCQLSIHRILESFLDAEISLISPQSITTPEINLASALPPKELIPRITEAIFTNLCNVNVTHEVAAYALRNLIILMEHDITFYYLTSILKQKSNNFQQCVQRIIESNETKAATGSYNPIVESLLLFLRSLSQIEDSTNIDATIPPRTLKLSPVEVAQIIGFNKEQSPHILQRMRTILAFSNVQSSIRNGALIDDISKLITEFESIEVEGSNNIATAMTTDADDEASTTAAAATPISSVEPSLPQTESIVTQYATRPVFAVYELADQAQLTTRYWLEALPIDSYSSEDFETKFERITCDLTDLAESCLPPDTNLTTDCKRVLHLSASPQSNRERTPTAPCFRTRRVEVEPSTGRPEKKIYITPVRGRGFSRAPPSRGDLFRSRPPNTSRPPSLHVDDFLALETCGAQPTGPTGYNKIPPMLRGSRVRGTRGARGLVGSLGGYRKPKIMRTASPSTWNDGSSPHYRPAAPGESHFGSPDMHYSGPTPHFGLRPRRGRARSYLR